MSRIQHQLELISMHIPKTAGTSFQKILEAQYPNKALLRLDFEFSRTNENVPLLIARNDTDQRFLDQLIHSGKLPDHVKAIHGHFTLPDIQQLLTFSPNVRLITWIREPLERVVSNYNYLSEVLRTEIQDKLLAQRLMKRLKRSVFEYASLPVNVKKYQVYLGGQKLDAFDFVGLTDFFDQDVADLAKMMHWKTPKSIHVNKTTYKSSSAMSAFEHETLSKLYRPEIEIYQAAIEKRSARLN